VSGIVGWSLAAIGIAIGYVTQGWRGALLAFSVIVFWLLLQLGRGVRVLRVASARPVGFVDSAVQLHAQLHPRMRLVDLLHRTRSLGRRLDAPAGHDRFEWTDSGGDRVVVTLARGRLVESTLLRADAASAAHPPL
jgi:hypothetical protein